MLYLAEDRKYLPREQAEQMRSFSETISRGIESLAKHLRK
jgi:hypothetical protein